ncbi:MAG: ABC transporter ATP-binding protein [Clostridiaceae bacterium]|jgi:ABC-2 type transport system ATP-binding protein|nr:ABC transporter ATP-binding protein [Clostridiaceae bacterium]
MSVLEIKGLKKYYGKQRGVENVSFSLNEGEIFGFIGPNGAGKTTTLRCILGLIFPDAGEIKVFGKDAIKDRVELAKDIGYLPGEVFFYEKMTVGALLDYAASFFDQDLSRRKKELCEWMELDLKKRIAELSLGNKKKLGIVQGLLHRPKLLLLDEPTSGLDPLMQRRFFNLLREEQKNGVTILFSSHILSEVRKLSERIAIIRTGEIVDIKSLAELEEQNVKRVHLQADEKILIGLDDLGEIELSSPGQRSYLYQGDINYLIDRLSGLHLRNVSIEEPDLEEVFMHYYEGATDDL